MVAPLETNLCWLLSHASYSLTTEMTAALAGLDVSPRAQHVLATAVSGEYTQTELARIVGVDKTTLVVTLDELEAKGLAERRVSSRDRRAHVIGVTPAGEQVVRQADAIIRRVHADVLNSLDASEREVFLQALGKLAFGRLAEPVVCSAPPRRRMPRAVPAG
jgi:MarR family transcriptional regulator for hemolysin